MKKKLLVFALIVLAVFSLSAETLWWEGRNISGFDLEGLKNVSSYDVNSALYEYRGQVLTEELVGQMEKKLLTVDGISDVSAGAVEASDGDVRVYFKITEFPYITAIDASGQSKVRKADILSSLDKVTAGTFISADLKETSEDIKTKVLDLYKKKGFETIAVDVTYSLNQEKNTVAFSIVVTEGLQTRIVGIFFEGNEHATDSVLKKTIDSKVKTLFNQGYLNQTMLDADKVKIEAYYQTIGYADVKVTDVRVEEAEQKSEKYKEVNVVFVIEENDMWYYGGMDVKGNTIFSDDEIAAVLTLKEGSVLNLEKLVNQYSAVADLYYNNGYISNRMTIDEERDENHKTIKFHVTIVEGPQAKIEKIVFTGLTKTKEYVMRRELTLNEGDVFSKIKLQTSAQNLYNTGLLSELDYDIYYGNEENSVILEFILTEGQQMDIQFGATFGGSVSGFPVSGFLQLNNRNLGGRGQTISVSTTLSPDSQSASVSFGDSWFAGKRWSNSFTLSFNRTRYKDELQVGTGSDQYSGWNDDQVWPYGYMSYEDYKNNKFALPSKEFLMTYRLINVSLGWTTGYTFIFDVGRLGISAGLNIGVNHAIVDKKYTPYEKLISKYAEDGLHFSNKLSVGVQWDGRDFVTNTTRGYLVGTSATYAGGFLGGLSNYIKTSVSAAGYLKLFELGPEDNRKNVMLAATTNVNFMLPQYYNNPDDPENPGWAFHDAKLGATKYEMLYIDGMTIARGHSILTGQSFLWDNMLEVSYPLAKDILNLEAFVSATAVSDSLSKIGKSDWYYSAGAGLRLMISGFPLGLYLVKNATYTSANNQFTWNNGSILGMNLVLAISTSLI